MGRGWGEDFISRSDVPSIAVVFGRKWRAAWSNGTELQGKNPPLQEKNSPQGRIEPMTLSCLMERRGFDPPLRRIFVPVEGIFSLRVYMGSDSIPQKSFG